MLKWQPNGGHTLFRYTNFLYVTLPQWFCVPLPRPITTSLQVISKIASLPGGIGVSSFFLVDVFMIAFYPPLQWHYYVPDVTRRGLVGLVWWLTGLAYSESRSLLVSLFLSIPRSRTLLRLRFFFGMKYFSENLRQKWLELLLRGGKCDWRHRPAD